MTAQEESWGESSQQRHAELAILLPAPGPALAVVGGKGGDGGTAEAQAAFAFLCSLRCVRGRESAIHWPLTFLQLQHSVLLVPCPLSVAEIRGACLGNGTVAEGRAVSAGKGRKRFM